MVGLFALKNTLNTLILIKFNITKISLRVIYYKRQLSLITSKMKSFLTVNTHLTLTAASLDKMERLKATQDIH